MAQLDALKLAEHLRQRMVDFAVDDNFVRDENLMEICRRIWTAAPSAGGLISDLWVEGAFPSEPSSYSLDDLVRQGKFDAALRDILDTSGGMPRDRLLYTHQYKAVEKAREIKQGNKPSIVVTAGTGSGKTEAFLLPLLDDLYRTPPGERYGMKVLILYPMNALVNDQVERLYAWLKGQSRVTLFHFTSETPENKRIADQQGVPEWEACRMRTRQQARGLEDARGNPIPSDTPGSSPDIVITNYSMLEYMLCRPQDSAFFDSSLRTIVLDEAHLYQGTLAAEITLLLRRLLLRCGLESTDVLQMATSATLGTGDAGELREFISQLFSKPSEQVQVVEGASVRAELAPEDPPTSASSPKGIVESYWPDGPTIVEESDGRQELAKIDRADRALLENSLSLIVSPSRVALLGDEDRTATVLHECLAAAPLIRKLEDALWTHRHLPLDTLSMELFGENSEHGTKATVKLLQLAASARLAPNAYPLVPHRLHILARPADGLSVCLNMKCSGPDAFVLNDLGVVLEGYREVCDYCEGSTLSLYRCDNCGEWLLAGRERANRLVAETFKSDNTGLFSLSQAPHSPDTRFVEVGTGDLKGSASPNTLQLEPQEECPNCEDSRANIRPFSSGTALPLSLFAETLLSEMPEFPAMGEMSKDWLPAEGRRLIAFSDSRREAARLGILLTNQHEQQLARSTILKLVEDSPLPDEGAIEYIESRISDLLSQLNDPDLSPGTRRLVSNDLEHRRQQLQDLTAGGSIGDWVGELKKMTELSQFLHRESSDRHRAQDWKQLKWEDNAKAIKKKAKEILGKEFATRLSRDTTLEALGLVEVTYPGIEALECPSQLVGTLPTSDVRVALRENWPAIVASLCDTLRGERVITLGDLDEEYEINGIPVGRWAVADDNDGFGLIRFVGATERQIRRRFVSEVLRRCGVKDDSSASQLSKDLLRACFDQLKEAGRSGTLAWLEVQNREANGSRSVEGIRLRFDHLGLRRPPSLFRCKRTDRLWPRSVLGCAPNAGSFGTLKTVVAQDLDHDPRVGRRRREYRESPIFKMGLWSEEHSAQLNPAENRRLQDLFKAGVRNILSATTTLELGIDIGGLNGVVLGNVPPGKANYLQRGGRAGRRADGSSIVATFARPRPFDREVFGRIGDYLAQLLRKPVVHLDRHRVVVRHLNSYLLNEFFSPATAEGKTGAMDAFGTMGEICGVQKAPPWLRGSVKPDPEPAIRPSTSDGFLEFLRWVSVEGESSYRPRIESLLIGTILKDEPSEGWRKLIEKSISQFTEAVANWRADYDPLMGAWQDADRRPLAGALRYQLAALYELTVIEALADRQFLPHYGFPIGVQKLRVNRPDDERPGRSRDEDRYRLERNSLLALREYVPGSQLLAGGKLVTSHGLLKHWTGVELDNYIGFRGRYTWCVNDHFYYWNTPDTVEDCPICQSPAQKSPTNFMFPKHGFSGAAWDPPKWSTNIEQVGNPATAARTFTYESDEEGGYRTVNDFGEVGGLLAHYKEDGELLVYNSGESELGFAICLQCGYADSERKLGEGRIDLPRGFEYHAPLSAPKPTSICWPRNTAYVIRNETFAAREVTDVLLIDFSESLGAHTQDEPLITTLGYALQRAAAHILQLDSREIGVLTTPAGHLGQGLGALLYDNVPGGAGHVRELLQLDRDLLERARQVLYVNDAHHRRCRTACLDCLLSFDTQAASFRGLLDRRKALPALEGLLDGRPIHPVPESGNQSASQHSVLSVSSAQMLSDEERTNRSHARSTKARRRRTR